MTDKSTDTEVQSIWKEQDMIVVNPTFSDINARISRLDRRIRRRNFLEYIAGAVGGGLLSFAGITNLWQAVTLPDYVSGAGYFMLAMALFFIVIQIFLRSDAAGMPDPGQNGVTFHLARLRRERNLLASAGKWYLMPLIPGFLLIYGAGLVGPRPFFSIAAGLVTFAVLGWVLRFNLRAARCLDEEIAELERD